ncbi:MAG: hypothetical protein ACPH3N_00820 [Alcanivorax sediminis]
MTDQAGFQVLAFVLTVIAMGATWHNRDWMGLGLSGFLFGLQIAALGGM